MKTVFFGPWIGEFGWEFMHWYAWVSRVCQEDFKDYYKIASSFSGREPFYPDVDKFIAHPNDFTKIFVSQRNYITDHWKGIRPQPNSSNNFLFKNNKQETSSSIPENQIQNAEKLLNLYVNELPKDTIFFVPWRENYYEKHNLEFGIFDEGGKTPLMNTLDFITVKVLKRTVGKISDKWEWLNIKDYNINNEGFLVKRIPFEKQNFFKLSPTNDGHKKFLDIYNPANRKPIISVFPRFRKERRTDKNWSEGNYLKIIDFLKSQYPQYDIAVLGAPGGCYFVGNPPDDCIDLINIDDDSRMDIHIAALRNSIFALGGLSGAILVSLAAGCPSLTWGHETARIRAEEENLLDTKFIYLGDEQPELGHIQEILKENLG